MSNTRSPNDSVMPSIIREPTGSIDSFEIDSFETDATCTGSFSSCTTACTVVNASGVVPSVRLRELPVYETSKTPV